MTLIIPDKYHDPITWLNSLDIDVATKLFKALSSAHPTFSVESLVSHVMSGKEVDVDQKVLSGIVNFLVSLYYIWGASTSTSHLHREDFVEEVINAAREIGKEANWERLKQNLLLLLQLDRSIGITAKALDLMTDYDRVFQDVRVITDTRPIFTTDDSDRNPIALMVTHMLKLKYAQNGEINSMYIAMDCNDIRKLQVILERALMKEDRLSQLAEICDVSYLDAKALEEGL